MIREIYRMQALEWALNTIAARRVKFEAAYQRVLDEWPEAFRSPAAVEELESLWQVVQRLFVLARRATGGAQ